LADHEAMSRFAVEWIAGSIAAKAESLLCLATGSTPTRTYELLAERYAGNPRLLAEARLLKLDEWGGLAMDDPASCQAHLRRIVVDPLGLADRYIAFQSQPADPTAECQRIAAWLQHNGPIDLCVLGLGTNGHLGFNEPAPFLQPHAHVARLSAASLGHAMLVEARSRPAYGLTLGMADLLQARQILLLVSGPAKREPLRQLLRGQISTQFPASLLHLHPSALILCDSAAAS
jgi:galactosamine-6-phosphate isomerase